MSQTPNTHTAEFFVEKITAGWQKAVESIIQTGKLLLQAKAELPHGEFGKMIEPGKLPFTPSTAQRLMAIARHPVLSNPAHVQHLPPSWGTLYKLTQFSEEMLNKKLADGTINAGLERMRRTKSSRR
jgi:hypothetical protein